MNQEKKCIHFRDMFHEFLIEPRTAPPELLAEWEIHESQCKECQKLFKQLQHEQKYIGDLVCALYAQPGRLRKKHSFHENTPWPGLGWCVAGLMIRSSKSWEILMSKILEER